MGNYLGIGWKLPVGVLPVGLLLPVGVRPAAGPRPGTIVTAAGEERIRESIRMILSTAPGERLMRPDFGCAIHDLVFAPNDAATAGRAAGAVREALVAWEPRIELLRVEVEPGAEPEPLLIEVEYRIRATDSRYNLVYPFYLE